MTTDGMRFLLVRNAQSPANVDSALHQGSADHSIGLTRKGLAQARGAGRFLRAFLSNRDVTGPVRMWQSPYRRARKTADAIMTEAQGLIRDRREHINLAEQQFGVFDGAPDLAQRHPEAWDYYDKCASQGGRFWARTPCGESRFDVAIRVRQTFDTFLRDALDHGIRTVVVVTHGVALRAFVMQWLRLSPEWFEREPTPGNGHVRLIQGARDLGYVHRGETVAPAPSALGQQALQPVNQL